ncbi:MAG: MraY family glycosyltransferase [Chitinophagaceae bacterium]
MLLTQFFVLSVSFLFCFYSIRKTIYLSHKKHLFDEPSEDRKIHIHRTPNLGGAALFAAAFFTTALFISGHPINNLNFIFCAAVIIFLIGLTDDLVGMNPSKKLFGQLAAVMILTIPGEIRITNFYGFLGLQEMNSMVSIIISILFCLLLINAINLIDGINFLAGSISLFSILAFSFIFWKTNQFGLMIISLSVTGSLVSFLIFNRTPARIFLGDSGSLFLGFIIAFFSIQFLQPNTHSAVQVFTVLTPNSSPAFLVAMLIVPIFDTLRVFYLRVIQKKSPFSADRNHIHHLLIDLNLSHLQATVILLAITFFCMIMVLLMHSLRMEILFLVLTAFVVSLYKLLMLYIRKINIGRYNKRSSIRKNSSPFPPKGVNTKLVIVSGNKSIYPGNRKQIEVVTE